MKQFSYELEGTATATHGAVRMGHLKSRFTSDMTLYKNLHEFRRKSDPNGSNKLFGWRKTDPSTGKPGAYEWVTLNDFLPVVEAAASGMSHNLKLQRGAIVGVFAKNCYQWSIVEHSASRMAYTLVPLYDTLACAFDFTLMLPMDVHLSYLPLAHCFERVIQTTVIYNGAAIGFYLGDVRLLMDDLAELQPTVFPSVPRLLNRIHDKISQGAAAAGGIKKWLFDTAYAAKKFYLKDGYKTHAFWDFVVFSKA
ncbi:hypothetical protein PF010_g8481 [Phytophthora fragariae]|uniref:AMP-dependent synthetase/ligase domain-containing protein n=1 Tax=Phytophthora fragariae TaxID=53985 RepID=A0A6G0LFA7_9STRA|nr:hypothetical protein PF010_g8481 [Phytophthora fragariae]